MRELFDHTADLGLRATAADLNALFAEMAACLVSAIVEEPGTIEPRERRDFHVPGEDREYLLFDWLKALLLAFEADRFLGNRFEITVRRDGLDAAVWGEPVDSARHVLTHEVKAITYHELKVVPSVEGWLAEVIVDI